VKYACIARHCREWPVRLMCECLGVSRAGFYAARRRQLSPRGRQNQQLTLEIRAVHAASRRRYGAPKVYHELRAQGIECGHNRVARLMRLDGLRAKRSRPFRVTTDSTHTQPRQPNRLGRRFAVPIWERDRAWVADVTYLHTLDGWLYLAAILDLSSRRVVGWAADRTQDQSLTVRALEMALRNRRPRPGLLHHSDQGVQYASGTYQALLRANGLVSSMSRRGDCWDNAVAESFFATLKTELAHDARWPTRASAQRALVEYIEGWYNHQRRHAALGYKSPVEFERELRNRTHVA